MTTATKNPCKINTGVVRLSYAHIWEPKSINGSEPKYSVSVIVPKTDTATIARIEAAIEEAKQQGKSKVFGGTIPKKLKTPLRDGDEEKDDEVYAGSFFFNANSSKAPGIVDLSRKPITDEEEVYSGCYARVSATFYPFNVNGNVGIAAGLNNLQKTRDGERLGGRSSAEDDFNDGFEPDYTEEFDFL